MRKIISIIVFSVIALNISAQEEKVQAKIFVNNNFNNEAGLVLKWISSDIYFPEGCNVYRKAEGENDWKKINSERIQFKKELPSTLILEEQSTTFYRLVKEMPYPEFKESFLRAFVVIQAINDNKLAEALGITYSDKTALLGKKYQYMVKGISNGTEEEIAMSAYFLTQKYQETLPPQNLKAKRTITKIALTWTPEILRYYSVNIFRKAQNETAFTKITKKPFAIQSQEVDGEKVFPKEFFVEDTLNNEWSYTYKLKAVDYFGQQSEFTEEIEVLAQDFIAPQAPSDFDIKSHAKNLTATLTWKASVEEDRAGFNVYRSEDYDTNYVKLNKGLLKTDVTQYLDKLTTSGAYYYYVTSIDNAKNESPSGKLAADIRDIIPPAPATNFTASADTGKVSFSWTASSTKDTKGYILQESVNYGDSAGVHFSDINADPILENTFVLEMPKNLSNNFAYRVVVVDGDFNTSNPSNVAFATLPDVVAPEAPYIKNVKELAGQMEITWDKNIEEDLAHYHLFRKIHKDTSGFKQVNINPIPASLTSYLDRKAEPGKAYMYTLKAYDNSGNTSPFSNAFYGKIKEEKGEAILEITNEKINKTKKQLFFEWESKNKNYEIIGYVIYKEDHTGIMKPITGRILETNYKTKIKEHTVYNYQIRAYAKTGEVLKTAILTFQY
jgi:hypothetical protein